jgi:hypothetical protein
VPLPPAVDWQLKPGAQSVGAVQPTVQAAFRQAWGEQSVVAPATHVPAPSHLDVPTSVPVRPGRQAAAAQIVPAASGAQDPALPARLQAPQLPHEALVQQTPSVHIPVPHSVPAAQEAPFGLRFVQVPETQL